MSNTINKYVLYGIIATTTFGAGVWLNVAKHTEITQTVERSAADAIYAINLPDLAGKSQALGQWRGKVIVVNFWATWCAPCREEIPFFVKMHEKYASKGLQFVGISIDQADKTLDFAINFSINYPNLIGTFDTVEISRQAGNRRRALPYTVVLDRKGAIVATELGGLTQEKLEAIVNPLL